MVERVAFGRAYAFLELSILVYNDDSFVGERNLLVFGSVAGSPAKVEERYILVVVLGKAHVANLPVVEPDGVYGFAVTNSR